MPVIEVREEWKGIKGSYTDNKHTAERMFIVLFSEGEAPAVRQQLCYNASANGVTVPPYGEQHPGNPALALKTKTVEPFNGAFAWKVVVSYANSTSASGGSTEQQENPLLQKPKVSVDFDVRTEQIDTDIYGDAICNSLLQGFDPPLTKDFYDLVIRVQRNLSSYNIIQAKEYINTVNKDYFLGSPPRTVKVIRYSGDKMFDTNFGYYWVVNQEFSVRTNKIDNVEWGWTKRTLDQGVMIKTKDAYGNLTWKKDEDITGDDTYKDKEIVLLDGHGNKADTTAKQFWWPFEIFEEKDFSALNLSGVL